MITVIMISITEKMKRIILANLNGHKLSFLLKLSAAARPKRKERLFSTQITPQEKDPAVGINGFEGVGLEWLLFQKKDGPCLRFGRKQDLKGERGKPIYRCMPTVLPLLLP